MARTRDLRSHDPVMTASIRNQATPRGRLQRAMAIAVGASLFALLPMFVVPVLGGRVVRQRHPDQRFGLARFRDDLDDLHVPGHLPGQRRRDCPTRVWAKFAGGADITNLSGSGDLTTGVVYSGSSTLPAGSWTIRLRALPAGASSSPARSTSASRSRCPPTPAPTPVPTPTPVPRRSRPRSPRPSRSPRRSRPPSHGQGDPEADRQAARDPEADRQAARDPEAHEPRRPRSRPPSRARPRSRWSMAPTPTPAASDAAAARPASDPLAGCRRGRRRLDPRVRRLVG